MNQGSCRLPRLLSLLPRNGVESLVFQTRWTGKGLPTPCRGVDASTACYYHVKQVTLAHNEAGKLTANAYGVKYWKGKRVTNPALPFEPIKGALKYHWAANHTPPALLRPS